MKKGLEFMGKKTNVTMRQTSPRRSPLRLKVRKESASGLLARVKISSK